jgi:hypothetical protein
MLPEATTLVSRFQPSMDGTDALTVLTTRLMNCTSAGVAGRFSASSTGSAFVDPAKHRIKITVIEIVSRRLFNLVVLIICLPLIISQGFKDEVGRSR